MRMIMRTGDKLGQRDAIAHLIRMQYSRNETDFTPRHLPGARRHDRRLPGRAQRAGGADRAVRRRARVAHPVRPAHRADPAEDPALRHLPGEPLRDAARPGGLGDRDDQGGAARPARRAGQGRQAGRGAAAGAADPVRPRDAAGDRPLQGDRELHPAPLGRGAGPAAGDDGRLPAEGRADVPRREPRHDRPARRHVQRRPGEEDHPGRLRLSPALGARQPAAQVRGVRGQDAPGGVRLGHAGDLREGARRPGGRAAGAADRADRPGGRGPAGDPPGRRRAAGDPRAGRGRTSGC